MGKALKIKLSRISGGGKKEKKEEFEKYLVSTLCRRGPSVLGKGKREEGGDPTMRKGAVTLTRIGKKPAVRILITTADFG